VRKKDTGNGNRVCRTADAHGRQMVGAITSGRILS
jgi:hypothetical protein